MTFTRKLETTGFAGTYVHLGFRYAVFFKILSGVPVAT
jgi:hypothetical protein